MIVALHPNVTSRSFDGLSRIRVLLNTLIGEHHVRRALLLELCELMADAGNELREVRRMSQDLLADLDRGDGTVEFDGRVRTLAEMVERSRRATSPAVG